MISFIDEHRSVLGVEPICRLLPIAPSTYYEVIAKRTDVGRLSDRELRQANESRYAGYSTRISRSMACGKSGDSCSERASISLAAPSHGS
jgi:hypothetical protein